MSVSFFGYGKTTRAIADRLGNGFDFYDDMCQKIYIDDKGNRVLPSSEFDPKKSDLEILTPSVRPQSRLMAASCNPVSEYDLFLAPEKIDALKRPELYAIYEKISDQTRPKTVWISGTNGKTTTTRMLTHILESNGAVSGGNIGTPLAYMDPNAPLWILETSSYTLHHTKYASADIYLLLPVTPDHIDWHSTELGYLQDKLDPLRRMREGDLALVPSGLELPRSDAWIVEYDSNEFLEEFFDLDASRLRYKGPFLQDALLAMAISRVLFDKSDYDLLNDFEMDRHRQEEILDGMGRLWINDSKATNLDAALKAIDTYSGCKLHLIAGGDDKGVEMSPLIERLYELDAELYAIGSNSDKLVELSKKKGVNAHLCRDLHAALEMVDKRLQKNEAALLSPAAASLDQFESYAHRGDEFVNFVKKLQNN